ncbi:SIR2 family protein [Methylovulum miyakonense]|uniref:SIR2 family protein n=1 Tax=Methylovulum miyakonense TaxID=645578 RepID=UPI000399D147|nr:SIR2 family protein [Methylovulum miyakonense]
MNPESVIFLLGAGASCDAGIPMAIKMSQQTEELLGEKPELRDLYYFLKSSIMYQRGLEGNFEDPVGIEDLLGVIEELNQKHKNKLYPFVGAWNTHLTKVAGSEFRNLEELDTLIRSNLIDWVKPKNSFKDGSYLNGLGNFKKQYGYAIRIFTLNYDLLLERNLKNSNYRVETGFDPIDYKWEASRFERNEAEDVDFYLYKMHGSIDWERGRTAEDFLYCRDDSCKNPELIFGVNYKLNSGDPYLFYTHELRKYSLESSTRLIFSVGYSFSDDYINKLLSQAIKRDPRKRIVNIDPNAKKNEEKILRKLGISPDSLVSIEKKGKEFFETYLTIEICTNNISAENEMPF